MNFLPENIDKYTEKFTRYEGDLLKELEHETYQKILMPRMCSGHLQGQVMRMISKMIRPKYILEVGTYTGYSAMCWLDGLVDEPDATLYTLDINEELEQMVRGYFARHPRGSHIEYILGDAAQIIPELNVPHWDLVFIDADKENYAKYYELSIDKVRPGGFIIADNVLWSGKVTEEKVDKDTAAIKEFNIMVHSDIRAENVLFPIRDGLMVIQKL